jgi:hypothetical protein
MTLLRLHLLLVVVASSYITLGVFATEKAQDLWLLYGLITLTLAAWSLKKETGWSLTDAIRRSHA